jgi:hypothetical protein
VRTACQFPHFLLISNRQIPLPIAITIAIKKRSGKIDDRFSDQNRSAISGSKSDPDFHFKIDQRLKNSFMTTSTDGMQNRIPIFVRKSISDFDLKIDPRFTFSNRSAILKLQSRSRSRSKTVPEKPVIDFEIEIDP